MDQNIKIRWAPNAKQFRVLDTNRDVTKTRASKILASIEEIGFVPNPIIVNERNEIIDGQARAVALETLGEPIPYIVIPGIGRDECVALNRYNTKWNTNDFIRSYARGGNTNYQYLMQLLKEFKSVSSTVITAAASLTFISSFNLQNGGFVCTPNDYDRARKRLRSCEKVNAYVKQMDGRRQFMFLAVMFASTMAEVDEDKLVEQISKYWGLAKPFTSIESALDELSRIYNYRSRRDKVFFKEAYTRYMSENGKKSVINERKVKRDKYKDKSPQNSLYR